ncbi:MAG: hypothetical protein QMD94_03630 [Candidatus Omnitrophota bacterium]|nr:hypothetical protein [Candidatus Omnitrophota bacterium]
MTYLFIGRDKPFKEEKLKSLKVKFLTKELEQFNLDTLYAKEITPKLLQEKLLCLPVKTPKRIVIIKRAEELKQDVKDFIIKFAVSPYLHAFLVLDIDNREKAQDFINCLLKYSEVYQCREIRDLTAFDLAEEINSRRPEAALRGLNYLLERGQKPELILGALRHACLKDNSISNRETKNKLKLLLNCDLEIKTGRLTPSFALEKLIISLSWVGE